MLLYHYCSVSSMMSIIENKYLRMTNALNTNDKTEFRYFKNKLVEYAKTTRTDSEKIKNTVEEIINLQKKKIRIHHIFHTYVVLVKRKIY